MGKDGVSTEDKDGWSTLSTEAASLSEKQVEPALTLKDNRRLITGWGVRAPVGREVGEPE